MFNEEIKARFVNEFSPDSLKAIYNSLFRRTEEYETKLNKDICDFNFQECLGILVSLKPKSITGVGVFKSQLNRYADWAIDNNLSQTKKNYWILVPLNDEYAKSSFKFQYVKDIDELKNIVDTGLSSKYDKYVIYLLYMGIMGKNCEELTLLREDDVRSIHEMIITKRRVYNSITPPLLELIKTDQHFADYKRRDENSIYFVKPFATKKYIGHPINMHYIYRIFEKLNENYFEATKEKKAFTTVSIWRSGLFNSLYKLEQAKKNDLTTQDFAGMLEAYGSYVKDIGKIPREYKLYKEVFWGE